ncbi:MAG: TetR/AcrR family transcriptional regulator [Solirubrobacterales bacterium]
MVQPPPPTSKGARQSQEILDAALRCLGRDGYASTSLARVAEEAGVSKRMVLYYFDSRETLFVQLTKSLGNKLLAQLEQGMSGIQDPGEVTQAGFERMWTAITSDRALLIALFGVTIESVTDERLAEAVGDFKEGIRELLRKQLVDARAHGRHIVVDEDVAVTAMMTGFFGLAIEWLESGDTPELQQTIAGYQQMVAAMAPPAM